MFNKICELHFNYKKLYKNLGTDLTIKYANVKGKIADMLHKKKNGTGMQLISRKFE